MVLNIFKRLIIPSLFITALLGSGCVKSPSAQTAQKNQPIVTSHTSPSEPCTLFSEEEASALLGVKVVAKEGDVSINPLGNPYCTYSTYGTDKTVMSIGVHEQGAAYYEKMKSFATAPPLKD